MNTTSIEKTALAPPGAGIPFIERTIGGVMLRWGAWRATPSESLQHFERQTQQILALVQPLAPAVGRRSVLIERLRGLEDSSRNWSVYQTVEHLRIVNAGMLAIILVLAAGNRPSLVVSTASVKPGPDIGAEVVPRFVEGCKDFSEEVAELTSLDSLATLPHPWFGELTAKQWLYLAGFHMNLHRHQIRRILRG